MYNIDNQFSGWWAIVIGGSSGFGLATIEKLARHGMNIAVLYRETASMERSVKEKFSQVAAASGITILPFNINALDGAGRSLFIQKFTETVGKKHCVRLLLHSIARGNLKPLVVLQDTGPKENNETLSIIDIQLTTYAMSTSLLDWARLLLKEELFLKDARIIGLTSEGANKFWEGYAAISIAKASLQSLTTYMAIEFGKYGLRTNLIQAGITETPSMKKIPSSKKLIEMSMARNPLGQMTRAEDVANVIYLLCTNEASWINGALIHADGGEHCL